MTLEQLQIRLAAYLAAETAILSGAQETEVQPGNGARYKLRAADLSSIQAEIRTLRTDIEAAQLTQGRGRRVFYVR